MHFQFSFFRKLWAKSLGFSHFGSLLIITIITNVFMAGLAFISGTMLARLLGPTGRGELAAIQTWPSFLSTLAMLGIPEALVYFSAREPERAGRWMITAVGLALVVSIPFVIFGYVFLPYLLSAQPSNIIQAARVYIWLIPIFAVLGMVYHPLRGRNDLLAWNFLRVLPALVWVLILISCWIRSAVEPVLLSSVYLISLTFLIFPISYVVFLRIPRPYTFSSEMVLPMLRYGLPSVLSTVPSTLNLRMDQMVMSGTIDSNFLGLYVAAVAWGAILSPLLTAFSSVILPKLAGIQSAEQQKAILSQSLRIGIPLSLILAGITAFITPWGLPLIFGSSYRAAIPAGMLLALAAGIISVNQILSSCVLSLNKPRYILFAEISGFCATALGLWFLLRPYKIMGAAITSIVSYIAVLITLIYLLQKETSQQLKELLVLNTADVAYFKSIYKRLVSITFNFMNKITD